MSTVRVLIADDHGLVRSGIRALLERIPDVEIVGEAANGIEALRLIGEFRPDVALVNISMPELNGLETTERAVREHPRTRVLIFSMHADDEYVRRALHVGAAGYLVKTADRSELELAIRAVARGETWISPTVSTADVSALSRDQAMAGPFESLTPRQREILQLIAEGNSTKEIASRLRLSPKTVESHRAQLMQRLGVRGIPALVRWAIRLRIVSLES
jgi:DNA-binding NarL/FixJ family response regulator